MASLTGSSIASSYEQLLALPDGGLNGTTLVAITDGDSATEVGFKISTNALSMNSTNQLQFGDTGTYIHQSADGVLDLVSDTEIEINATTIDMNGALDLSGNALIGGTTTINGSGVNLNVISDNNVYLSLKTTQTNGKEWQVFNANSGSDSTLQFKNIESEKLVMLMTDSADIGIGTASPAHKLDVVGTAGLSTGTAWTNTSDSRVKTNIETISDGLAKIEKLRPVSFNYTDDYLEQHPEIDSTKRYNSFIAQEYKEVFPNAVNIGSDLEKIITKGVAGKDAVLDENGKELESAVLAIAEEKETLVKDVMQFTPHDLNMYLVAAVQELSAKVAELEKK